MSRKPLKFIETKEECNLRAPSSKISVQYPVKWFNKNPNSKPHTNMSGKTLEFVEEYNPGAFLSSKFSVQYPVEWFNKNPNSKPLLTVPIIKKDLSELRGIVKKAIQNGTLTPEIAMNYVYLVLKEVKETLDEDWMSYNVTIGTKGSIIRPWDLLTITESDTSRSDASTTAATANDDAWMVCYSLGIYSVLRVRNKFHRDIINARIRDSLSNPREIENTLALMSTYTAWQSNRSYNKMVACVDMFFTRFPDNQFASARVGTITSRFKDCSALLSVGHMSKVLGLSEDWMVLYWIFTAQVGREAPSIAKGDEEITSDYSYFPYQSDLGLVHKTAYSSVANPHLFFLIHATCSLLGSPKSQNARCGDTDLIFQSNIDNAKLIAYVFARNHEIQKRCAFTADGERVQDKTVENPEIGSEPVGTNATEWYKFFSSDHYIITEKIQKTIKGLKDKIVNVRKGSIGKFVKENF